HAARATGDKHHAAQPQGRQHAWVVCVEGDLDVAAHRGTPSVVGVATMTTPVATLAVASGVVISWCCTMPSHVVAALLPTRGVRLRWSLGSQPRSRSDSPHADARPRAPAGR